MKTVDDIKRELAQALYTGIDEVEDRDEIVEVISQLIDAKIEEAIFSFRKELQR